VEVLVEQKEGVREEKAPRRGLGMKHAEKSPIGSVQN
jgi:hypothetical protein